MDRARKVRKTFPDGCKTKPGIVFRYCKTNILQLLFDNFSDVTIILVSLLSSFRRYYHHQKVITFDTRLKLYFRQWKGTMRKIKQ
jgi:hypothetical protein